MRLIEFGDRLINPLQVLYVRTRRVGVIEIALRDGQFIEADGHFDMFNEKFREAMEEPRIYVIPNIDSTPQKIIHDINDAISRKKPSHL